MKPAPFAYARPASLDDALRMLSADAGDAMRGAGGTGAACEATPADMNSPWSRLIECHGVELFSSAGHSGARQHGVAEPSTKRLSPVAINRPTQKVYQ